MTTFPDLNFQQIFEAGPARYLLLAPDSQFTILAVTDAYLQATMTQRDAIVGKGLFSVFPDNPEEIAATGTLNLRASLERVVECKQAQTMAVQKYDIRRPDSEGGFEERYWSPVNSPVLGPDGEVVCIIHRVEDVTEFVRLKQQRVETGKLTEDLRERFLQMETEVYLRASEVQEANRELARKEHELGELYRRLQELDRLKTQFFANVSHELRTPLTLILHPVRTLLGQAPAPELRRELNVIERNAELLLKHVNDLLEVARLDAGQVGLTYVETDLAELVRLIAQNFESLAQERVLSYRVHTPPSFPVQVDADKIERVLMNLLSNAFKFTPTHGSVEMSLHSELDEAVLVVSDSGEGVPLEIRDRIFERFFQAQASATRKFNGTGLGLTIARDFAGLHGGSIRCDSDPLGGARLTVRLPTRAPKGTLVGKASPRLPGTLAPSSVAAGSHSERAVDKDDDRPLVLVVEDNPDMQRHICELLSAHYRTASANDGQQGFERAMTLRPDLILSDMMMPEKSGLDLLSLLRRQVEVAGIPVVILTALDEEEVRVQVLRAGAEDYVIKPFSVEELRTRVGNLIQAKKSREALEKSNQHLMEMEVKLLEKNQELEAFSSAVSHDLRAPLRALDGFSQILLRDYTLKLDERGQQFLGRIRAGCQRIGQTIEALLVLSQVSRQSMLWERVDLSSMANAVAKELVASDAQRQVEFRISENVWGDGDPHLLRVALDNLFANAWKFTNNKLAGCIEFGSRQELERRVFFIKDNGAGFDMAYAGNLFQPFRRLHSHQEYEGTGVGLATVRRVIHRHAGRVWAEGKVGQGATFFFTLGTQGPPVSASSAVPPRN